MDIADVLRLHRATQNDYLTSLHIDQTGREPPPPVSLVLPGNNNHQKKTNASKATASYRTHLARIRLKSTHSSFLFSPKMMLKSGVHGKGEHGRGGKELECHITEWA